jgi:hypothetical protein
MKYGGGGMDDDGVAVVGHDRVTVDDEAVLAVVERPRRPQQRRRGPSGEVGP